MGFKTEQFVEKVDENLMCGICLEVLEDPWQCRHGHVFCKDCITRCLVTKKICPECNDALQLHSLARCLRMKNFIEKLKVYCHPQESDGQAEETEDAAESKLKCDWTGKLQTLAKHRETCPFQQVQCPNVDCNTNMQRRELEDHDKICEYKELKCDKQCGVTLIRRDLPNHKTNDCPEVSLSCPNECGESIKRKDIPAHRETCPLQQVQCPNVNCNTTVQRRKLKDHDTKCRFKLIECDEQCGVTLIRRNLLIHKRFECPEVRMSCPNCCGTNIKRKNTKTHRETCLFQKVRCPNVNCKTNMQRRELENHDKICEFKLVECEKCREVLVQRKLQSHKVFECPEELVPCRNKCRSSETGQNNEIKRVNIKYHLTNDCPKAILDCPFKDQGCLVQVERQHVEKHVQDNMAAHMMLLAKQCSSLTKQNSALTEQCTIVTEQCSALTKKCSTLAEQNTMLTEQCSSLTEQNSLLAKENEQLKEELNEVKKNEQLLRTYRWKVENFARLRRPLSIKSPNFWLCGYSWCLKLDLNSKDEVSVELWLDHGCGSSDLHIKLVRNTDISVTCRLTVTSQRSGTEDLSTEKHNVFNSPSLFFPRLQCLMKADDKAYCDKDGNLIIKCTIQVDHDTTHV